MNATEIALDGANAVIAQLQADLATSQNNLANANQECADLKAKLVEEKAIVDRVWKALGISDYEQAKPLAIDEHVATLRATAQSLRDLLKRCEWKVRKSASTMGYCSFCDGIEPDHKTTCALAAELKATP